MGGGVDAPGQGGDDGRGHLVLDGEDVLEVAVVSFRPEVVSGGAVDELGGDADPVARLAHAAFEHVAHAELPGDGAHVHGLALVGERGVAGDDEELADARQRGEDVLGDAVGEELLFGIA